MQSKHKMCAMKRRDCFSIKLATTVQPMQISQNVRCFDAYEEIHSARLTNTFLWKRYLRQKQGIQTVHTNNTSLMDVEQVKEKLLTLSYIRDEIAEWESRKP